MGRFRVTYPGIRALQEPPAVVVDEGLALIDIARGHAANDDLVVSAWVHVLDVTRNPRGGAVQARQAVVVAPRDLGKLVRALSAHAKPTSACPEASTLTPKRRRR